jgi:hypothetical protein
MILRCNPRCKMSDGTTDGLLDLETDKVMCSTCGDEIQGVSSFTRSSMKLNGEVIRAKSKKAFVFGCLTCNKNVEAKISKGIVVGKNCQMNEQGCKLNITKHMVVALEGASGYEDVEETKNANSDE